MRVKWGWSLIFFWSVIASAVNVQGMIVKPQGGMTWPGAIVPYMMSEHLTEEKKAAVLKAMTLWESETVIRFVPISRGAEIDYPDYVMFEPNLGNTCVSSVGRRGGIQSVRLAPRCDTMHIAHELGHLIGLWHEQSRLDRDLYVEVLWSNIREEHYHNFNRHQEEGKNQGPYDYDSIMHYSATAFSKNGEPTIVPRMPGVQIGQRTHLSAGDIASVNALYNTSRER